MLLPYKKWVHSITFDNGDYSLKNLSPREAKWILFSGVSAEDKPEILCEHLVDGQKIEYKADVK